MANANVQKVIKTGNSAALTIPAKFVKALNLRIGDQAQTNLDYWGGAVTYKFVEIRQLRLGSGESTVGPVTGKERKILVKKKKHDKNSAL